MIHQDKHGLTHFNQSLPERADTACEEEGPVAFVITWFVSGSYEQKNGGKSHIAA